MPAGKSNKPTCELCCDFLEKQHEILVKGTVDTQSIGTVLVLPNGTTKNLLRAALASGVA